MARRRRHRGARGSKGSKQSRNAAADRPAGGGGAVEVRGILELDPKGTRGWLRDPQRHLVPRGGDPVVPRELIRTHALRGGELIRGVARDGSPPQLERIEAVEDTPLESWTPPTPLQETIAVDPDERLRIETPGGPRETWVVSLFAPIGRGQRALVVAPPRTGKTILLQQMAHGITTNHPDVHMIVLLIDERPEEVTEMRRSVRGEVIASSNDLDVESHVRVARLVIERARRLVEMGQHVVVLLDSITRLARAFNSYVGSSGRTMTGGLDIRALQEPKQIFGSARAVEGGGSLTIIGTALVQTGSRADEFIFQEFKGTGNTELVLSRELANLRIWPAIDLNASGTRKEEKLLDAETLRKVHMLRRHLNDLPPAKQIPALLERMARHETLQSFLDSLA